MCEGASGEGAAPRKDTVVAHSVGSKVFVEDTASDDAWVEGEVLSVDDGAAAVVVKLHGGKEVRATCEGPSRRGGVQPPANHPPTTGRVVGPLVHSWRPKAALRRAPGAARGAGGGPPGAGGRVLFAGRPWPSVVQSLRTTAIQKRTLAGPRP